MSKFLIVEPLPIAAIGASRGSGAQNLLKPDPKEVWADSEAGGTAVITVQFDKPRTFDTILLGNLRNAAADATWVIVSYTPYAVLIERASLRVPDVTGAFEPISHALWRGGPQVKERIEIRLEQPAGAPPLQAGTLVIGNAFAPEFGQEWGSGRRPIDTGVATALPGGGFAVVEGARKRSLSWTFGDLSIDEADRLEQLAMSCGETKPVLVIEDDARTAGLRSRIHYGLFEKWRAFERRNRRQTRWELGMEEWV